MSRQRIICINRRFKEDDAQRHISHVGIGDEQGWSRVLMVEEAIAQLQLPAGDRFYVRGRDGWEAEVGLGKCLFCTEDHLFIRSAPDLNAKDKLLTLPHCS